MNRSTHIDLTKTVALAMGWPGDVNTLARAAALPDEVLTVRVEGIGHHFLGHNLASLLHFCVPYGDGFRGYNYKMDGSLPGWNLPDRKVETDWEEWGFYPCNPSPLDDLVIRDDICLAADDFTFPTAAVMAQWIFNELADDTDARTRENRDTIAGMICHFVQDCCVPHHTLGELANGHGAFEANLQEWWCSNSRKLGRLDPATVGLLDSYRGYTGTVRSLCEWNAREAHFSDGPLQTFRLAIASTRRALELLKEQR